MKKSGGASGKESIRQFETQETQDQSLGWEDPLEQEMQPSPVFLPGKSPETEEPGGLQSMGLQRLMTDHTHNRRYSEKEYMCVYTHTHTHIVCVYIYTHT